MEKIQWKKQESFVWVGYLNKRYCAKCIQVGLGMFKFIIKLPNDKEQKFDSDSFLNGSNVCEETLKDRWDSAQIM